MTPEFAMTKRYDQLKTWFERVCQYLAHHPEGATCTEIGRGVDPDYGRAGERAQNRLCKASQTGDLVARGLARHHFRSDHSRGVSLYYTAEHARSAAIQLRRCRVCEMDRPILDFAVVTRCSHDLSEVCNECIDADNRGALLLQASERSSAYKRHNLIVPKPQRLELEEERPRYRVPICPVCLNLPHCRPAKGLCPGCKRPPYQEQITVQERRFDRVVLP